MLRSTATPNCILRESQKEIEKKNMNHLIYYFQLWIKGFGLCHEIQTFNLTCLK